MSGQCSREYSTNKKRAMIRRCYLNRILAAAAPTLGSSVWYAHTRGLRTPRQCAVRGQAGGWRDPGCWPLLCASHARCRGGPLPALAPAACEGLRRSGQRCWPLAWAKMFRGGCITLFYDACGRVWSLHTDGSIAACRFATGWRCGDWLLRTASVCGPWELQERVLLRKIAGTGHGHERA